MESGRRENPTVDTVRALARVLGCKLSYLVDGEGPLPSKAIIDGAVGRARVALAKE